MNKEIRKKLELRQENLISLLKTRRDTLELEKQHQIYGAIKEIDYIIRMLKVHEEEEAEILKAVGSEEDVQIIKVSENSRKLKLPFNIKFKRT